MFVILGPMSIYRKNRKIASCPRVLPLHLLVWFSTFYFPLLKQGLRLSVFTVLSLRYLREGILDALERGSMLPDLTA